jgi:cytochrome P450
MCSTALARILHLLSEHPTIQDQLRAEILNAPSGLQNYDKLPYLDAVIREALRLYSPVPTIERYATKDWVLPLRYPTKEQQREIKVKKGTVILVSLSDANRCR